MVRPGTWDWMWTDPGAPGLPGPVKHEPALFRDGYAWAMWFHECYHDEDGNGCVYVISQAPTADGTEPKRGTYAAKVGRATNVEKRLGQLQTGNPNPLRVEIAFRARILVRSEESAQHTFPGERALGEWFWTPASTVRGIRLASSELYPGDFNG